MKQVFSLGIIVLITLLLFFGCAYYNILFNAKKSYNEGIKEMEKSADRTQVPARAKTYFQETIDKCWKLIDLFSENSKYADDALLYICKSEYYLEKYVPAREHLEQFINKYPKSKLIPEANLWYGKVLMRLEEFEKADESLRTAINTSEDSKIKAEAYFELGSFEFNSQNYEAAIEFYQKALDEDPDDQYQALLQFNLGEAYYIQENYENAIKFFKKVEKYDPSLDVEYNTKLHLANSYSETGKYENAYKILRKMLTAPRFNDFIPVIKTAIGENYEKQGLYLDAMDIYKETISEKKSNPGTAQAAFNLGRMYENVYKNVDSAVVYYGKVSNFYRKFDSLETAQNKEIFLRELKDIRDDIKTDKRLIYKLENDEYFRDSLYAVQYEDSMKRAMAIAKTDTQKSDSPADSIPVFPTFNDTSDTSQLVLGDSLENGQIEDTTNIIEPGEEITAIEEPTGFRDFEEGGLNKFGEGNAPVIEEPSVEVKPKQEVEEVELRKLPQIKHDLMSNRYQLAEYYLLKVQNYDSAAVHYKKFLSLHTDTLLTPKALFSLRFIYSQPGHLDSAKVDSIESLILNDYPESIFAKEILKQKRLLIEEKDDEEIIQIETRRLFLQAESLYFADQFEEAIQKYEQVAELDTISQWGAKAMYAKAWIYEKELNEKELALDTFERIIKAYPKEKDYLKAATEKTTMPKETVETVVDTTQSGELVSTEEDTLLTIGGGDQERIQGNGHSVSSQIIERDKIRWRMNRYRK